jgi:hypothetical protein
MTSVARFHGREAPGDHGKTGASPKRLQPRPLVIKVLKASRPDELAAAEKALQQLAEVFGLDAAEEKTYLELSGRRTKKPRRIP